MTMTTMSKHRIQRESDRMKFESFENCKHIEHATEEFPKQCKCDLSLKDDLREMWIRQRRRLFSIKSACCSRSIYLFRCFYFSFPPFLIAWTWTNSIQCCKRQSKKKRKINNQRLFCCSAFIRCWTHWKWLVLFFLRCLKCDCFVVKSCKHYSLICCCRLCRFVSAFVYFNLLRPFKRFTFATAFCQLLDGSETICRCLSADRISHFVLAARKRIHFIPSSPSNRTVNKLKLWTITSKMKRNRFRCRSKFQLWAILFFFVPNRKIVWKELKTKC